MERDVAATLDMVADVGFQEVEFAGYFGHSPTEIRDFLDKSGLRAPAAHVTIEDLTDRQKETLDGAQVMGHDYLVVAWLDQADRSSLDDLSRTSARFNRIGEACQSRGIVFAYHNHAFEFEPIAGRLPYDVLLEQCDPGVVKFEIDLFWIREGGADPLEYFERWPGRFHLCHVKDRAPDGSMVDVGSGTIDFAEIFAHGEGAGLRHFIVEHDEPDGVRRSIESSFRHLAALTY